VSKLQKDGHHKKKQKGFFLSVYMDHFVFTFIYRKLH
jgi:hypothetical protein